MKLSTSKKMFGIAMMALLIFVSAATDAMGQGRGRGRRGGRDDRFDRKCEKFVNCHDARDGRWDGRGPDRDFSFRRSRRNRRFRDRDRDRDFDTRVRRRRQRDRDFDRVWWRR